MLRAIIITVAASMLLCALQTSSSLAVTTPSHKKAIWGPSRVNGVSQFPLYRDLGVGIYQTAIDWSTVALRRPVDATDPNDPAYTWPAVLDDAVTQASASRIRVSLMVWRTPLWANGGRASNVPPTRTADYADFIQAAARRYPTIRLWMIWGEPIRLPNYLLHPNGSPDYYHTQGGKIPKLRPFNAQQRADDRGYAELVDASYSRLKGLSRRNLIIGGNTTTSGNVDPLNWIKNMRLANGRPPRMDMFGHNPFSARIPDLAQEQLVPGTADFSDLDLLATWLDRYLARGSRNHRLPIFVSEFTIPTDVPSFEFPYHGTRSLQAKWLSAGLRIARKWSRIYTFGWIGLRDPAPVDGRESRTGLIDGKGVRKPSYFAYRRG